MEKAIVIGAGIGGIATSIRLAHKGYRVTVFDKNDYPGGKLTQLQLGDYRFDAGPSLFTMPRLVDELLELAEGSIESNFRYKRLETLTHYFYEDGLFIKAHSDPNAFASEIELKTGTAKKRVLDHLQASAYIHNKTSKLFLANSLHKLSTYSSINTLKAVLSIPKLPVLSSLHALNSRQFKDERLVQLFNRYATYNGSDPYKAPGMLHIIPHLEFNEGAYFPHGGMHQITSSLVEKAVSLGVQFKLGREVNSIVTKGNKVCGITVDGNEHQASIVVCNGDIQQVHKNLLRNEKKLKAVESQERSSSALIFYWGIKKEFPQLDLHNIFFSADYREEFDAIFNRKELQNDPTIYINITSKLNSSDAPAGCENWFVMINVAADDGQEWKTLVQEARQLILDKLNRILKLDLEEFIEVEDTLTPLKIQERTSSYKGALYGTASNTKLAAFFRPKNYSSEYKGLYFVGGSVHPGGGIPLALSSAKIVGKMIPPVA